MNLLSLNGAWTLAKASDPSPIAASVPGCVHTDLLANGLLEDPFYRDNELRQTWVGETDWRYARTFTVPEALLAHERLLLRFHGLDTIAEITLNGTHIASADNMFRTWEIDVTAIVQRGDNLLEVAFRAPMPYVRQMDAEKGTMAGWVEPMRNNTGAWIRKEPCNFGWDWGPKMPTCGIWRSVELVGFDGARLDDVAITQAHQPGLVTLSVQIAAERLADVPLRATVQVSLGGVTAASAEVALDGDRAVASLPVSDPALWWVNGLGDQPLYTVEVTLHDADGGVRDRWTRRIGLRTLTLERHPDQWGESFYFACNGVPFFAKGANWIPLSPYPGQAQPADYARFIEAAAAANMNMLRAWGGGIYEEDAFYDTCDALGIAVWQDFMFACGTYPSFDAAFMANVAAEAHDNVRRLRHHACIALWCGNNEIEQGLPDSPGWLETMSWEQYSLLFDDLLANIVRELAPDTAYWPGSPHSPCGDRSDHRNPTCGDTHLWDVWHGRMPFEWYRTRPDRFVSEFGFQSFPEPTIVNDFTLPDDRSITSFVMEHHQRSGIGNSVIIHYMLDWFRLPTSFDSTLWLSQILQGMAMKYAVEGWRRNMPRSMGALYWQLNDLWPAPSWASLDWTAGWKALHYLAKRFFAPIIVSGVEDAATGSVGLHVVSDAQTVREGTITFHITDAAGAPLESGTRPVTIPPGTATAFGTLDVSEHLTRCGARDVLVWLSLSVDGETVSEDLVLFSRPKHLQMTAPNLTWQAAPHAEGGFAVQIACEQAALYTWLSLPGARFSDNFVHLRPGVPVTIQVQADSLDGLRLQSLYDTYQ